MSRTQRVIEALGANYLSFAITALIKLFITPFFLGYLGPELMGFKSFIRELLCYFQLTGFGVKPGIAAIVSKEFQQGSSMHQEESLIKIIRAGGQFQQMIALIALLFSGALAVWLGFFSYGLSGENLAISRWCTIIYGLCLSLSISSGVYSGILTGSQLIAQSTLYNLFGNALTACIGALLVYVGWSLYGVASASLVSAAFVFFQLRWRTTKLGIRLRLFQPPLERDSMPRLFKLSGWIFLAFLGGLLSTQSSQIILGITPGLGMSAVNQFMLLVAVPYMLRHQTNRFSVILRPGLIQLYHSGVEPERMRRLASLVVRLTGVMAATSFVGIFLINGWFVMRWVGTQYYAGDQCNVLVAILIGLTIWTFGFKVLLEVRFKYRRRGLTFFASGLLTAGLALVLARRLGLPGVIIAGIISETLIIFPFIVYRVLSWLFYGKSWIRELIYISWLPLLLITLGILVRSNMTYQPSSWMEVIMSAFLVGSICMIAGGIWLWSDLRRYGFLSKLSSRFSKNGL